jgi:hypothetical protein
MFNRMRRFLPFFALFLAGCATPTETETRKAVIRDTSGKLLAGAEVELLGDPPKFYPFGMAMGDTYTRTVTDSKGTCMLTYPKKQHWQLYVRVPDDREQLPFLSYRTTEKADHLEITAAPPVFQSLTEQGKPKEHVND